MYWPNDLDCLRRYWRWWTKRLCRWWSTFLANANVWDKWRTVMIVSWGDDLSDQRTSSVAGGQLRRTNDRQRRRGRFSAARNRLYDGIIRLTFARTYSRRAMTHCRRHYQRWSTTIVGQQINCPEGSPTNVVIAIR